MNKVKRAFIRVCQENGKALREGCVVSCISDSEIITGVITAVDIDMHGSAYTIGYLIDGASIVTHDDIRHVHSLPDVEAMAAI